MIHVPHPATREQLVAAIDQVQAKARANVVDAGLLADEALAIWRRAEVAAAALELPPGRLHARASVWLGAEWDDHIHTVVRITSTEFQVARQPPPTTGGRGALYLTVPAMLGAR